MAIKFLNSIESIALPGTNTDYYIGGSGGGVASNALRIGSRTTGNTIAMELFHALNPVSLGISYSGGDALAFIDSVHSSFDSVLQFKTGGDERFRVGALNANTFQIKPASAGNDVSITDNSGNAILYSDTSTQRIGIGTTSPSEKFDVVGNAIVRGDIVSRDTYPSIYVDHSGTAMGGIRADATNKLELKTLTTAPLSFQVNSSEKMRILSSGNVGINETNPQNTLHVNGTLRVGPYFATSDRDHFLVTPGGTVTTVSTPNENANYDNSVGNIHIRTNSGYVTPIERLTVLAGGNVGIGTTSPSEKLDVVGTGSFTGQVTIPATPVASTDAASKSYVDAHGGGTGPFLPLTAGPTKPLTGVLFIGGTIRNSSGDLEIRNQTATGFATATKLMQQTANGLETFLTFDGTTRAAYFSNQGNVGIGTTSPAAKLDVDGDVRISGDIEVRSGNKLILQRPNNGVATEISTDSTGAMILNSINDEGFFFNNNGTNAFKLDPINATFAGELNIPNYIFHAGDVDTYIGFPTANEFKLVAGGNNIIAGDASSAYLYYQGGVKLQTRSTGVSVTGEGIFTGNVGIGTTSPTANLDVTSALNQQHLYVQGGYAEGTGALARIKTTGNGNVLLLESATTSDSREILEVKNANGTVFLVRGDGNVGIGTTSPSDELTIEAETPTIRLKDISSSNYAEFYVNNFDTYLNSNGRVFLQSGGSTRATVTPTGNVGIGTTSPSAALEVVGGIKLSDNSPLTWATSNTRIFGQSGYMQLQVAGSDAMRLTSAGNVGIGTISPSEKLEVDGQVLSDGYRLAAMQTAPAARNSTGTLGEIVIDGNHIYVCYATNSWSRVALETSW